MISQREPDFIVGPPEKPYLLRWWLIPHNRFLNVYLHKFINDDDGRALHDHPWPSLSLVLSGGYYEITRGPDGTQERRWYGPGSIRFRPATLSHRIELRRWLCYPIPCRTLFITGPKVREWGFWCPKGWVPWREFVDPDNPGTIGPGCGDLSSIESKIGDLPEN